MGIKTNLANKAKLVQIQTGASTTYPNLFPCRPSKRNASEGRFRSYSKPAWSKVRKPMLICFFKGWFTMQGCIITIDVTLFGDGKSPHASGWPNAGTTETFQMLIASGQKWTKPEVSERWKDGEVVPGRNGFIWVGLRYLAYRLLYIYIHHTVYIYIYVLKPCKHLDVSRTYIRIYLFKFISVLSYAINWFFHHKTQEFTAKLNEAS